ncbi:hypothetical protein ACFLQ2_02270 [archaeon]
MRGQVTIEYILVLVIMLVILATVSIPTIEQIEVDVTDTGNAINLAAVQQRIASTAREMSLTGCGSTKNITVHIQQDLFTPLTITWDGNKVGGQLKLMNGTDRDLKDLTFPDTIKVEASNSTQFHYWDLRFTKDCGTFTSSGCIGDCGI